MTGAINYSIIIPHSDISHLLDRLLSTVPVRNDVQVIVVDDCSAADELNRLESLKEKYPAVEFYSTGMKGGGGKARNVGLKHAVGKWILFADADDYFNVCFYETIGMYCNSDADIVYFGCNSVDTDTYRNANRDKTMNDALDIFLGSGNERDIRFTSYVPWSKMYRKSLIDSHNLRFDETKVSNDVWFSTIADFYAENLAANPRAIYCVTNRAESVSKQMTDEDRISRLTTELKRYRFLYDNGYKDRIGDNRFDGHILPVYIAGDKKLLQRMIAVCQDFGLDTEALLKHIKGLSRKIRTIRFLRMLGFHK